MWLPELGFKLRSWASWVEVVGVAGQSKATGRKAHSDTGQWGQPAAGWNEAVKQAGH